MINIKFKKLDERAVVPEYKTVLAAGADLYAVLDKPITIRPFERIIIDTGLAIELPAGYEAQIRPRSGLAVKHGLSLINAIGTVDADYRNSIGVPLVNLSLDACTINPGDRIAQMVIAKHEVANFIETDLSETERGMGGFGSTGVK